ncbi:MAG: hypothetical protein LBF41_06575 [Deltaproteobacteria bacterium]|jgi:hypothetical protein|nr:hypothetical protein [Deltaproteobacteria bacterium]
MSQLLHVTDAGDFYPESFDGITPCQIHGLLFQLLKTEVSEEAALVPAEPVERPGERSVAWHTSLEGKVRTLEELNPGEARAAYDLMCLWSARFASLGGKLLASPSVQRKLAGKLVSKLATAMAEVLAGVRGAAKIYMVGEKPVLCAWGMAPVSGSEGAKASRAVTAEEREKIRSILEGGKPEFKGFVPPPPPPAIPPESRPPPLTFFPSPPPPPSPVETERGPLWFLLLAFPAFAATLILFFLFVPGMRELPLAAGAEERDRELAREQLREGELKRERDILRNGYFAALVDCSGRPLVIPLLGSTEELEIPETGDDLSFMEGCWISDSPLVNSRTSLPIVAMYCFNERGEARSAVDQYDSAGNYEHTCLGSGTATREGASVTIRDFGAKCPVDSYAPSVIGCETRTKGAPAVCRMRNLMGKTFDVTFIRVGKN